MKKLTRQEKKEQEAERIAHSLYVDRLIAIRHLEEARSELPEGYAIIGPVPYLTWSASGINAGGASRMYVLGRDDGEILCASDIPGRLTYAAQQELGERRQA